MPALRGVAAMSPRTRRRSSVFAPAKAGVYGVPTPAAPVASLAHHLPPRPISFAPNVTPVTFNESSDSSSPSTPEPLSPNSQPKLFPPSEIPAPPPTRKRCPPGKRRSQGYIPRPPNAFMLFRADFVRQKHVPGSIETNHGSLSKIIGNCWRSLPLDEKRVWEQKAKHEKAAHKIQYPNYRFRPVHNKNKKKIGTNGDADNSKGSSTPGIGSTADRKDKPQPSFEEEIRCEEVTALLLEGKKGEELALALKDLETRRKMMDKFNNSIDPTAFARSETPSTAQSNASLPFGVVSAPQPTYPSMLFASNSTPLYLHRRSSSVPLPPTNFDWNGDYYMDSAAPQAYGYANDDTNIDSSSAGIALPSVPFLPPPSSGGLTGSSSSSFRPPSPLSGGLLSKQQRMMYGHRRSSSAGAAFGGIQRSWAGFGDAGNFNSAFGWGIDSTGAVPELQTDDSALPDVDLSLFDPSFLSGASLHQHQHQRQHQTEVDLAPTATTPPAPVGLSVEDQTATNSTTPAGAFNVLDLYNGLPPPGGAPQEALGPLDTTGLNLGGMHAQMVSPVDSTASSNWNPAAPQHIPAHMQHHQHHRSQSSQDSIHTMAAAAAQYDHATQQNVNVVGAGQYEQMYLAEQEQHQHSYGVYEDPNAGAYDMSAYVNVGAGAVYGAGGQTYVEC
ncbi:hypothetical protein H1R20_g14136, partial [Candolleomyces eurysporus]